MTIKNVGLIIDVFPKKTILFIYHDDDGNQQVSKSHEGSDLYDQHRRYISRHYDKTIHPIPLHGVTVYTKISPDYQYTMIFPEIIPNAVILNIVWRHNGIAGTAKVITSPTETMADRLMLQDNARWRDNIHLAEIIYNTNKEVHTMNNNDKRCKCDNHKTAHVHSTRLMQTISRSLEKVPEDTVIAWIESHMQKQEELASAMMDKTKPAIAYAYNTETSEVTTWYRGTEWHNKATGIADDACLETDTTAVSETTSIEPHNFALWLADCEHGQTMRFNMNKIVVFNTDDYAFIADPEDDLSRVFFTAIPKGRPDTIDDSVAEEGFIFSIDTSLTPTKPLKRALDYLAANGTIVFSSMRRKAD